MSIYLLDTNILSYIAKRRSSAARTRLESLGDEDTVCISAVTEAEVRYGLAKRPEARTLRAAIEGLLFKLRILPWGSDEAAAYGDLRARLETAGIVLSAMDMMIAAQAIATGAVLVTNDKAFSLIQGLHGIENWAADVE